MKTKWKVQEAPTGRYKSFERRGWPQLLYEDGKLAASIQCDDDYSFARARIGKHAPLTVLIYDYSLGVKHRKVRKLVRRFDRFDLAKKAAETSLAANPEFAAHKRTTP